ncbi:unnamed protein product [Thelazia callipaeda]|uniref:Anoctamin n=1 Tax=Thelazia callipaeda TaxID=103827 RepID=A0A0N5CME9_THECL|nr:unnamed protein product [Thelazia callipaeda]
MTELPNRLVGISFYNVQKAYDVSGSRPKHYETMYFKDGKRKIDYILTYDYDEMDGEDDSSSVHESDSPRTVRTKQEKRASKRLQYEINLRQLGLELEHVDGKHCKKTRFVLVHAPFSLLLKQAESLSLKMPVLRSDIKERTIFEGILDKFIKRFSFFTYDEKTNVRLKETNYFTAPFIASHIKCYVGHEDPDTFFDDSERSRLVYDLLIRTRYDTDEAERYHVGIQRLIKNGTYTSAFPLHEECDWNRYNAEKCTDRELLYWNWARITNIYKFQPLSLVKKYFGSKVGWYFAWLGYYTKVLMFVSVIGIMCFSYGVSTVSEDIPSNDICGSDGIGAKAILCPTCDKYCDYTRLNSSCIYSKLSYVFDNTSTVVFAALMSIFATLFLEGWKRYHAEVAWKWGLLDFEVDEETIRPEYQLRVKKAKTMRFNPVTQQQEPYLTFRDKFLRFVGSGVTVLFFLFLVLAFVIGIIIYRIVFSQVLYRIDRMKPYANLVTFTTAATLNLAVILAMSYLYTYLALKLTDWECPRTQRDFDNSYTFKVFLFQFINYYSSIFYIAFVKGNLSSVPGRQYFGLRPEECDPAGCMVELVIQLAIIMCGKQFWNGFVEFAWPLLMTWLRSLQLLETKKQRDRRIKDELTEEMGRYGMIARWEHDYILNPVYEQFLFDEYLEMVIQFGFVTLFVSAFPLAPLFALLNNILEIRVDAYKYVVATRRPMPERERDIGIWLPILNMISRAAVLACIIAFTSDFIPRFVYRFVYMHDDLYGFVNSSLSFYDSSKIFVKWSQFENENITVCRFRDYRKVPCTISSSLDCDDEYGLTMRWWIVFSFRLAFILIFEQLFFKALQHTVALVKAAVAYVIPDIPANIFIQLQRQRFLARQARISDITSTANIHNDFKDCKMEAGRKNHVESTENNLIFEPGQFDDESTLVELEKVRSHSFCQKTRSCMSLQSQESDSFYSCQGLELPSELNEVV